VGDCVCRVEKAFLGFSAAVDADVVFNVAAPVKAGGAGAARSVGSLEAEVFRLVFCRRVGKLERSGALVTFVRRSGASNRTVALSVILVVGGAVQQFRCAGAARTVVPVHVQPFLRHLSDAAAVH